MLRFAQHDNQRLCEGCETCYWTHGIDRDRIVHRPRGHTTMSAETHSLQTRLRNDLRTAMQDHDTVATLTLRSLLDAMDNACAVPMTAEHVPVHGRSGDVPRRVVADS